MTAYEEAAELYRRIGARTEESTTAYSLSRAHVDIPQLRNLDQAEYWCRRALDLTAPHDHHHRAAYIAGLGRVAFERFRDAKPAGKPEHIQLTHLNNAAHAYHQALNIDPTPSGRAVIHTMLGAIYNNTGQLDTALHHFQQAIRYREDSRDRYGAGRTRFNVALALAKAGRAGDALLYAYAALRDHEPYGPSAAADIDKTQALIAAIEHGDYGPTG